MTTKPPRALIADDSAVVRQAICRRLANKGLDIVEAEGEDEVLAMDASTLSVVVLDIELGASDGTLVAESLLAKNPTVRIAFFTSGSTEGVMIKARSLGLVFDKPDGIDALISWILGE